VLSGRAAIGWLLERAPDRGEVTPITNPYDVDLR